MKQFHYMAMIQHLHDFVLSSRSFRRQSVDYNSFDGNVATSEGPTKYQAEASHTQLFAKGETIGFEWITAHFHFKKSTSVSFLQINTQTLLYNSKIILKFLVNAYNRNKNLSHIRLRAQI
jgi:hypothetical protein